MNFFWVQSIWKFFFILFPSLGIKWFDFIDHSLIILIFNLNSQSSIIFLHNLVYIIRNISSIIMFAKVLQFLWINWNIILIDISVLELLCHCFINVDNPVGCFPWISSFCLLDYLFFGCFRHSYIVIFPPFFLKSVVDEWKVMAAVCSSLVHTNWV